MAHSFWLSNCLKYTRSITMKPSSTVFLKFFMLIHNLLSNLVGNNLFHHFIFSFKNFKNMKVCALCTHRGQEQMPDLLKSVVMRDFCLPPWVNSLQNQPADSFAIQPVAPIGASRRYLQPIAASLPPRVSSKREIKFFGSNRNKPKQDLFRVCFGLFRETKRKFFRFISVFRTLIETTETNRTVSKGTETIRNFFSAKTQNKTKRSHSSYQQCRVARPYPTSLKKQKSSPWTQ